MWSMGVLVLNLFHTDNLASCGLPLQDSMPGALVQAGEYVGARGSGAEHVMQGQMWRGGWHCM